MAQHTLFTLCLRGVAHQLYSYAAYETNISTVRNDGINKVSNMLTYSRSPSLHLSSDFSIFTFFYFVRSLLLACSCCFQWVADDSAVYYVNCADTQKHFYAICSADMRSPPLIAVAYFFCSICSLRTILRLCVFAIASTISMVRFALSVLCTCVYGHSFIFQRNKNKLCINFAIDFDISMTFAIRAHIHSSGVCFCSTLMRSLMLV